MILLVVIFILMMQFLWVYIDELVGKGLSLGIVAEFLFWGSCTVLPLALPLATLLASMMTIGNMGENNELIALKAAGVSVLRVMLPILIASFFKIGLFTFGGGYAMLSMIQGEVVTRYGWLTSQEFTDIVAISQMTPGPIGINSATYVGYTTIAAHYGTSMGVLGSCIATFAVVLPSFILMLTISKFFLKYQKHPAVEAVFSGLRPAVVGLLASAALEIGRAHV